MNSLCTSLVINRIPAEKKYTWYDDDGGKDVSKMYC